MTTSKEMVLIGGITRSLRGLGSWTGETHIQKTAYVAKMKCSVPFESDFVLYKHGPFSFEMSKSIVHMLGRGLLFADPNPGYGPSFRVSDSLWGALNSRLDNYFQRFEADIERIARSLGMKNVADLERVATAVFVSSSFPALSDIESARMITQLKPHISLESATSAIDEANSI